MWAMIEKFRIRESPAGASMASHTLPVARWDCRSGTDSLAVLRVRDLIPASPPFYPAGVDRRPPSSRFTVANIKSQKKRNITNAKRAERNRAVRSEIKTRVKSASVDGADDAAVRAAISRIDSAAAKGVIHKNAAARKKSRLMKKANTGA